MEYRFVSYYVIYTHLERSTINVNRSCMGFVAVKVRASQLKGTEEIGAWPHGNCSAFSRRANRTFCYSTLGFKTILPGPYTLIVYEYIRIQVLI
jgi:hypothetical protein